MRLKTSCIFVSLLFLGITSFVSLQFEHGSFFPLLFIPIVFCAVSYGTRGGLLSGSLYSLYIFIFIYFILNNRNTVPLVLVAIFMFVGVGYIVGKLHDLFEKTKMQEKKLSKALEEKDFLMRELNHRVKNNLNMVSALISFKEVEINYELSDIKSQIEAISLVHEKLYQHNKVDRIELGEYLQNLLESVFSFAADRNVQIVNKTEGVSINSKTAISLGLIVNEIATNAIKYGFTEDKETIFSITLTRKKEDSNYILTLSNTGRPFPEDISFETPDTLGLQLIASLVDQLNGTIALQKKPNPVFTIRFPLGEE